MNAQIALRLARTIDALYHGTLHPTVVNPATDTQVRVQHLNESECEIIFPGTASLHDTITDLKIRKREFVAGKVHRGFRAAHESVYDLILEQLPKADARLTIAGHSLGGALATLLALDLAEAGFHVAAVYTFGSPRVGNGAFARAYNARLSEVSYRITNAGDPIPATPLPLPTFTSGIYTHVAREFYLNRDGGVDVEPWFVHTRDAIAALRAEERAFLKMDHPIRSYIAKLEALQFAADVVEQIAEEIE